MAFRFSCSKYFKSRSPILTLRKEVGILLIRIWMRDRRPCACR